MNENMIAEILCKWRLALGRVRPDMPVAGSPERSEYRVVVESVGGQLYVLERIAVRLRERKARIAQTLEALAGVGVQEVQPYLRDSSGEFISESNGGLWQIVPFVPGIALERPQYVHERWRGKVMGEMLVNLRRSAEAVPLRQSEGPFSLPYYIDSLMSAVRRNRPDIYPRVQSMHVFAQEYLYPVYPSFPSAFCHGDYHPVNIIWKENGIAALIDWEFMGFKPELYDAANMVGCLGIEDPECLWRGSVGDFVTTLRSSGLGTDVSFCYFLEMVISLRFAWLSEWLRKKDEEMIEMELDYFDVLNANREDLAELWGC